MEKETKFQREDVDSEVSGRQIMLTPKRKMIFQHTLTNSAEKKPRTNIFNHQNFDEKTHAQSANFNLHVTATTKGRVGYLSDQSKRTLPGPSKGKSGTGRGGQLFGERSTRGEDF